MIINHLKLLWYKPLLGQNLKRFCTNNDDMRCMIGKNAVNWDHFFPMQIHLVAKACHQNLDHKMLVLSLITLNFFYVLLISSHLNYFDLFPSKTG